MKGIRIANEKSDLSGGTPADVVLDTSLETLPIAMFGKWDITVYSGYTVGGDPLEYRFTHGLGYVPTFKGWEAIVVSGERTLRAIPTEADANGFLTNISADKQYIYVRTEFSAFSYAGATYRKTGYVYVYEKDFKLP